MHTRPSVDVPGTGRDTVFEGGGRTPDDHDLGLAVQGVIDTLKEPPELVRRVDPHTTCLCFAKAEAKLSSPMFMR